MADFDIDAASNEIGAGLGFEIPEPPAADDSDLNLDVPDPAEVVDPAPADPAADPTTDPTPDPATDPAAPPTGTTPPSTWRKEALAEWDKIPPAAQAEIIKREEDIFRGLESYKQDASFGKAAQSVLAPYLPILQQYNIDPMQQLSGLMQSHYTLTFGTMEEKSALIQQIAKEYGVTLSSAAADDSPAYIPPEVQALQKRLESLESQQTAAQRASQREAYQANVRAVEKFAADPKNIYVNELADDMAALMRTGVCRTLEEAYDRAMWSNPAVRAKELSRQQAEKESAAKKAAAEAAAKAKSATSANVKTSAKARSAATPAGSIDDTLAATLAAIHARS